MIQFRLICTRLKNHMEVILYYLLTLHLILDSKDHSILWDIFRIKVNLNWRILEMKPKIITRQCSMVTIQHQVSIHYQWKFPPYSKLAKFRFFTADHRTSILALFGSTAARNLFSSLSIAYLCGHLHNGGGVIPKMQHMHRNGVAELELADWKKNRMFRILSFDHDIFSYTDQKWKNEGIYIHITNPPQWQLTNPSKQVIFRDSPDDEVSCPQIPDLFYFSARW